MNPRAATRRHYPSIAAAETLLPLSAPRSRVNLLDALSFGLIYPPTGADPEGMKISALDQPPYGALVDIPGGGELAEIIAFLRHRRAPFLVPVAHGRPSSRGETPAAKSTDGLKVRPSA